MRGELKESQRMLALLGEVFQAISDERPDIMTPTRGRLIQ